MQENKFNEVVLAVKRQISIVNVIGGYIALKKKGNKFWGCCPFHNEKTASFTVSEEKGFFYCFGCHAGGDAWLHPHFYSADGGAVPFDWRHPLYAVCYKG